MEVEMDIVEKVATDIADIPGDPSSLEIARVAIEAYQRESRERSALEQIAEGMWRPGTPPEEIISAMRGTARAALAREQNV
jgi:hypothetical protein